MSRLFNQLFSFSLLLGISFTAASAADTAEQPIRGGTLIAAIDPEPSALTATFASPYSNRSVSANIFDGLLTYDDKFQPQPNLAESWSVSPDGKTITFKLRHDVKWHARSEERRVG